MGMPRPPRVEIEGGIYHVTCRGNGRERIFWGDDDFERFIDQMGGCVESFGIRLYAYVLMDNHFHLLVCTPEANLGRFMQQLNTSYAMYARYKHRRPGHQMQGRYGAKLVDGEGSLLRLTRYIHLNPVKTKAAQAQADDKRVEHLEGYRWSSYRGYVDRAKRELFMDYTVLEEIGGSARRAGMRYRRFVHSFVVKSDEETLRDMHAHRYAVGGEGFRRRVERQLAAMREGQGSKAEDVDYPRRRRRIEEVERVVCKAFGVKPADLRQRGRHGNVARAVMVDLACRHTGLRAREVGRRYNLKGPGVTRTRARVRTLAAAQPNLFANAEALLSEKARLKV